MERKTAAALVVGMCLLWGATVGAYRLVLHTFTASTARPTTLVTASGRRLTSLFSGLPPHPDRFDLVRIRKTTADHVGSAGCLPSQPRLLAPLSALFNPTSVHA